MADYIDREAALDRIEELQNVFGYGKTEHENGFFMGLNRALAEVDNFPAADAVPVVRGRWKHAATSARSSRFLCSECGGTAYYPVAKNVVPACGYRFCPNCGARMDGEV